MNTFQIASQNLGSDPTGPTSVLDTLVYNNEKSRAVTASKARQNFLSINGRNFGPSNQVHFSIACGRKGAFLDPKATFLKFRLVNKAASGVANSGLVVDGSAH